MTRKSHSIILIGPNVLLREGLARIIGGAGFRIVASAPTLAQATSQLPAWPAHEETPLVIIDFANDFARGLQQLQALEQCGSTPSTVVLSSRENVQEMVAAFYAGARAYLVNVSNCEEFLSALELVMRGETILPAGVREAILPRSPAGPCATAPEKTPAAAPARLHAAAWANEAPAHCIANGSWGELPVAPARGAPPKLSPRQQTILRCLIYGDTNKAIARKTALSEATVKIHVKTILRKIQVRNRTQAAIWAMTHPLGEAVEAATVEAKAALQRPRQPE